MTQPANAGDEVIYVGSSEGFSAGVHCAIGSAASATYEFFVVESIGRRSGSLNLQAPLEYTHVIGEPVVANPPTSEPTSGSGSDAPSTGSGSGSGSSFATSEPTSEPSSEPTPELTDGGSDGGSSEPTPEPTSGSVFDDATSEPTSE